MCDILFFILNKMSFQSISKNTYYRWNAEHPDLTYSSTDNILFNVVKCEKALEIQKKYPGFSSFTLKSNKPTSHCFSIKEVPNLFYKSSTYKNYDVSEILRGDYSRLFFDVDCKFLNLNEIKIAAANESDILIGLEQITELVNIITHSQLQYFGGYVETCLNTPGTTKPTPKIKKLLDKFGISENMVIIYNPYTKKEFSAHFYLTKYYFKRDDLYSLFSDFNSKIKKFNSKMAECIDCSVYVRGQRVFRFPLSGKCLEGRKPTPYMPKEIDFDFMVCGKTELDDVFISNNSPEFNSLKLYLNSLKLTPKTLKSKKAEDELIADIEISDAQKKILRKYDVQCQWFYHLIKLIKLKIFEDPKITEKELFDEFIQPKYQYITQTHKNVVINAPATKTAIKKALEKELTFSDLELFVDLKYTFTQLQKKLLNKTINILQLAELIHNSFVFFSKIDTDNPQALDLAYLNDSNEINISSIENFDKIQRANPTTFKVLIKKDSEMTDELIEVKMNLSKAIRLVKFRNIKKEYSLYTKDVHSLSLFSPVYPEKTDILNKYHDKILDLMADERTIVENEKTGKLEFVHYVNQEKKQFLINFFAYIVQHPENRNRICLQLSSVPGLGKNMFTNSICQFLGKFAWGNSSVDNVIGNYNGGVDTKLLIVMNEADTKDKNTDKMKSTITEDEIPINVKFGRAYTGINRASYVIFTNHLDTKTIASNDRRFAFIKSNGVPMPKTWYSQMIDPENGKIKEDLVDNLIGYLLNVDLVKNEYNPSLAPMFDKKLIYDARFEKRSIYYKIAYFILHLNNPVLLKTDFINIINQVKSGFMTFQDFEQTKDIEELEDLEEELHTTRGEALTNKTIANLIQFNDEDDMEMRKWNKGDLRNKHVLCLK